MRDYLSDKIDHDKVLSLIKELRHAPRGMQGDIAETYAVWTDTLHEAADEIERLQAQLAERDEEITRLRGAVQGLVDWLDSWVEKQIARAKQKDGE